MKGYYFRKGLKIVFFAAVAIVLMGGLVMFLWNFLMPDLFGSPKITFPQSLGLLVLSKILFGGFRGGWCGGRGGCYNRHHHWKEKMKEKFESMSPEEKEKFNERCSHWSH